MRVRRRRATPPAKARKGRLIASTNSVNWLEEMEDGKEGRELMGLEMK